ncbi:MAG TPA: diguanylate cyclase [Polyangiaceae bacterium]|nr:diguanylate cyclase [Polyangiaceae bacterium]
MDKLSPGNALRDEIGASMRAAVPAVVLENTRDGVWLIDADLRTVLMNAPLASLLGYETDEVVGRAVSSLTDDEGRLVCQRALAEAVASDVAEPSELRLTHKSGALLPTLLALGPVVGGDGLRMGLLAFATLSTKDTLTSLHNRRHIEERLVAEISRCQRYHRRFCLLMVGLDNLETINDRWGRATGDELIRRTARTLQAKPLEGVGVVRVSDELARYRGGTFVVVATETGLEGGAVLAQRVLVRLRDVVVTTSSGEPVSPAVSVGVASFPLHAKDQATLFAAAGQAMLAARTAGGSRVCLADKLARAGSVLVVDANERSRETISAGLESHGYVTLAKASEGDALDELRSGKFSPDIILIDATEGMAGEALARLCVCAKVAKIDVVLLSESPRQISGSVRAALRNPQVVAKSANMPELLAVVGDLRQGKEPPSQEDVPAVLRTT